MWDISQTEGDPIPTMEARVLTGDRGQDTYAALAAFATRQGLTVTNHDPMTDGDDTQSTYNGYYSPSRQLIFVKQAAPAQMVKTLCHELAHHLDPELQTVSRAECETVAEATAFVVAAHHHIDTGSYRFMWTLSRKCPHKEGYVVHVVARVRLCLTVVGLGILNIIDGFMENPV